MRKNISRTKTVIFFLVGYVELMEQLICIKVSLRDLIHF